MREALLELMSADLPASPVVSLPHRHRHPEAGGSPGGEPVEGHLPVPVQRQRAGGGGFLQWLRGRPRARLRRPAALDHPRARGQPGPAHQRAPPAPPQRRGGEDPRPHGGHHAGNAGLGFGAGHTLRGGVAWGAAVALSVAHGQVAPSLHGAPWGFMLKLCITFEQGFAKVWLKSQSVF